MSFQLQSFRQVLKDIHETMIWYLELEIPTAGTRLEALEQTIGVLLHDLESKSEESIVRQWFNTNTYYAFTDGAAFGRITRELGKVGPNLLPRHKLRTILEGPLSPVDEHPGSANVNARNIFTELELAAHFSERGVSPLGFDDLQVEFEGTRYHIECKRLLSPSRVVANIQGAYSKLQKVMGGSADRGMIAVAVERVMHLDKVLRLLPGEDPSTTAEEITTGFQDRYGSPWHRFVDPRIVAIIVICRFLVHTVQYNVIGPAYYAVIANLASPLALQATDLERLRRLAQQLRYAGQSPTSHSDVE
jgi:hypothetical protein